MSYWVRPVALVGALAAHIALIVPFSVTSSPASTMPSPIEKTTRVNFTAVSPPPPPVKQEPPKVKQVKPQQIVEKSKPKPQPKIAEVVKTKPKPPKPVLAKVEAQKESLPKPKAAPVPLVTEAKPKPTAPQNIASVAVPVTPLESPMDLERQKQRYLARLLEHIDAHKHYPRAAQRRGIEGEIMVSFLLLADGSVQDIQVSGDNKLLRKAAQKAVYKAMPLPLPNKHSESTPIEYSMAFKLMD